MNSSLDGRTVLIVGGARTLGLAVARAAAAAGAHVVIGARDIERATDVATELGGTAVRLDVTDESTIAAAAADLGRVDHVVHTAAAHHDAPVTELEHDLVVRALEAKVVGPLMLAKHLAPQMAPDGSILLFSGVAAWHPAPGRTVMGVTNGAVDYLARHLARELAPIRVNAISPGIVDSGVWDRLGAQARDALLAEAAAGTLVGRSGRTEDIVAAALWLLGAGFVSGETLHVEGGSAAA